MTAGQESDIQWELRKIFQSLLSIDESVPLDSPLYNRESNEKWDSLNHVLLVSACENAFAVSIDIDESIAADSFAAALELIKQKTHR